MCGSILSVRSNLRLLNFFIWIYLNPFYSIFIYHLIFFLLLTVQLEGLTRKQMELHIKMVTVCRKLMQFHPDKVSTTPTTNELFQTFHHQCWRTSKRKTPNSKSKSLASTRNFKILGKRLPVLVWKVNRVLWKANQALASQKLLIFSIGWRTSKMPSNFSSLLKKLIKNS